MRNRLPLHPVFYLFAHFPLLTALLISLFVSTPRYVSAHYASDHVHTVAMLIVDADSYLVNAAVKSLDLPAGISVQYFIHDDLLNRPDAADFIQRSDAVIVDVMGPELTAWVLDHLDPAIHRIYALRGSRDDDSLRRRGLIFDESIQAYFSHLSTGNIRKMIYRVIHQEVDQRVTFVPWCSSRSWASTIRQAMRYSHRPTGINSGAASARHSIRKTPGSASCSSSPT
jgi:hypothetical protein